MRAVVAAVLTALCIGAVAAASGPVAAQEDGVPTKQVRIVNLNLLHGVFCAPETNGCQAPDRVALLMQQLEDARCPEIVGLQEINANLAKIIDKALPDVCDGGYHVAFRPKPKTLDTERVLTTLPVRSEKVVKLPGQFRTASRAVLKAPTGPLVLVVTHQDGDAGPGETDPPCQRTCPPVCTDAGVSVLTCQTVVAADLADKVGGKKPVRVLMGDFNIPPHTPRYQRLIDEGWVDAYLTAGNPECDPATGVGCTAGRADDSIDTLKDPNARNSERIDFIFVKSGTGCIVQFDAPTDANDNGLGTRLFGDEPAVDGPGGIVWTSDHTGVSADISCGA
jgi:endonuclease/exonuclease/phosphatase family metal-dependent hydrolase